MGRPIRHGKSNTQVHTVWSGMLQRCNNKRCKKYKDYGGRGIKICSEWLKFENFYADMGDPPSGLSLERVDNDGNYCPENCIWGTHEQQGLNKRNVTATTYKGKKYTANSFALKFGLNTQTTRLRLQRGWKPEAILAARGEYLTVNKFLLHKNKETEIEGWKEATIAWAVCASIHRQYCKGRDPFYKTRQQDFVKHENDARKKMKELDDGK